MTASKAQVSVEMTLAVRSYEIENSVAALKTMIDPPDTIVEPFTVPFGFAAVQ